MKKLFSVSIISLSLVTVMELSFAQNTICRDNLLFGPSGPLLADANQRFDFGDQVAIKSDGSATVTDRYGNFKEEIAPSDCIDGDGGYVSKMYPRGDGLRLFCNTVNDLKGVTKARASLCEFEPTGFTCAVSGYYCACYYGDPDDMTWSCNCGNINDSDSCL